MIRDYHLQRFHFQDTNWRILSTDEICIIRVFIHAWTHSTVLSQSYLYQQNQELLLSSGIHYQSIWWYGADWELRIDLVDVPISMCDVVQNCRSLGPKPGNGQLVTVPVLPSTIYFSRRLLYGLPKSKLICEWCGAAEICLCHEKCYQDNRGKDIPSPQASTKLWPHCRTYLSPG